MLKRIEDASATLSRAEAKVAEWVLEHPRQASASTLAEVAAASGASEPTVIRFCRRIGLSGFREFTRWLAETLSRPASYVHRDVSAEDTIADAVTKVLDASIQALVETRAELAGSAVENAVARLRDARQIIFAGLGASGHVAGDACHKYFRLGKPCSALTDPPMSSRLAQLAVLDALQVSLALALGEPASRRLRASKQAIGGRTGGQRDGSIQIDTH